MNLLQAIRGQAAPVEERMSIDDYIGYVNEFAFAGLGYNAGTGSSVTQTLAGGPTESVGGDFRGLVQGAYAANGIVFSCMLARQMVFSAARFQYQRLAAGRPSELFGNPTLALFEAPWPGGTTQDLLARMIQDVDLAGNSYWTELDGELVRMRPDWVTIVLEDRRHRGGTLGRRRVGYFYEEGGSGSGSEPVPLMVDEVAHFAPQPDPLATYRGMSWLTPIVREIQADRLMGQHQRKFFENGATPNMIIKHDVSATQEKIERFAAAMNATNAGVDKAYKALNLYPGADATVVGADFKQIDFKVVRGHGETRIAAAAGVPPVIVGLSEGLEAATYSNYAQARRRFADGTVHPLWQNAAGSLNPLRPTPSGVRLWYDTRDVPFLREDEKDAAVIAETEARTIRTLVDGGYTPDSVQRAVLAGDFGLLSHSGLYSVQLQVAGAQTATETTPDEPVPGDMTPMTTGAADE